jgi:polyisoprenoid-binding protein YceI
MKRFGMLLSTAAALGSAFMPAPAHAVPSTHAVRPAADTLRLVVAPAGNEARYRVREQLARINFPSDAVGTTDAVRGRLVLDERGAVVAAQSEFIIELATIATDSDRRDNFVRRNTLTTEQHPNARFVPTTARGLPAPLPASGEATFQLTGMLTIRDVTKPVTWDVTARFEQGAVVGLAKTQFAFADFDLTKPRVASVLSVDDDIRLEYQFRLVPAPAGTAR